MYCEHCGAKLEEGEQYCWKCGTLIEDEELVGFPESQKKSRWEPTNVLLVLLLGVLVIIFCIRQYAGKTVDGYRGEYSEYRGEYGGVYILAPGSEISVANEDYLSLWRLLGIDESNDNAIQETVTGFGAEDRVLKYGTKNESPVQKKLTEKQYNDFANLIGLVTEWSYSPEKLPLLMTEIPIDALEWNMLCRIYDAHHSGDPRFVDESEKIGYEISECRINEKDLMAFCEENYGKKAGAIVEATKEGNSNLIYQDGVFHFNSVALWGAASPYYATVEKAESLAEGIKVSGHVVERDWLNDKELLIASYSALFDASEKTTVGYEFESIQFDAVPDDEFSGENGIFLCDLNGTTWYAKKDGSLARNEWVENGKGDWYYFDSEGHMVRDQWIDGTYYVGSDGLMLKDTITPDGYRVGPDGAWMADNDVAITLNNEAINSIGLLYSEIKTKYPGHYGGRATGTMPKLYVADNGVTFYFKDEDFLSEDRWEENPNDICYQMEGPASWLFHSIDRDMKMEGLAELLFVDNGYSVVGTPTFALQERSVRDGTEQFYEISFALSNGEQYLIQTIDNSTDIINAGTPLRFR